MFDLEDFNPGDVFKHWPGKTVTEMDNHLFSLLTMNPNPLHIDDNYMKQHQHGQILVNGTLVLSLVGVASILVLPTTSRQQLPNWENAIPKDALFNEGVPVETA